ncbi:MAG: DEAD/DEAH box helicase, partial [Coriobacteriia bacterium]
MKLQLESVIQKDTLGITCSLVAVREGTVEKLRQEPFATDHIVLEDTWYPYPQGFVEEVKDLLKNSGIMSIGDITLRQYVSLISYSKELNIVENSVSSTLDAPYEEYLKDSDIPLFRGSLYPYQITGYRWLKLIANEDAGCILADEMGLGKTIQLIAMLANEIAKGRIPSLVVAPVTLAENWRREIHRFAPELRTLIHQGPGRTGFPSELTCYDIVITSYDTAVRDFSLMRMIHWNIVLLDEAQAIKNPDAKRTKSIKSIPRRVSIAVTGTPVENNLLDLWSITDFAFQGLLGSKSSFDRDYASQDTVGAKLVADIVSPILLRRRVIDVARDLPERIDIPQVLEMETAGSIEYEKIRREIEQSYGQNASLVKLTKLRMFCAHPYLLSGEHENPHCTPKYERLCELLDEIFSSGEKVLIFTSFNKMADILTSDIRHRFGVKTGFIDGRVEVEQRQEIVDKFFCEQNFSALILNPKAAGVGLNITSANHVIHYNLEWNPATEDQASARAYRRGQTL